MTQPVPATSGQIEVGKTYWLVSTIFFSFEVRWVKVLRIKRSISKEVLDLYTIKLKNPGGTLTSLGIRLGENCFTSRKAAVAAALVILGAKEESLLSKKYSLEAELAPICRKMWEYEREQESKRWKK